MTQRSYYFDGISRGDAVVAPYSAELFAELNKMAFTANRGFVIPDYLGNFYVMPGGGKTIDVLSGGAWVDGIWFESTATENITVPDNVTPYNRIDYVIIRINKTAKTGDIVLNTGVPSLVPLDPSLRQTDEVWEEPIAKIISVPGFVGVSCTYIYDLREFIKTASHENNYITENIMFNSEFIGTAGHGALSTAPAMWEYTNTPTISYDEPFDEMARGSKIILTLGAIDTVYTDLLVANNPAVDTPVTIRMLLKVTTGEVTIVTDGGLGCTNIHIVEEDKLIDLTIRTTFAAGNPLITFIFSNPLATDSVIEIGQIAVTYGYVKPAIQPKHELILFGSDDDSYSDTVISTGTQGVLASAFSDTIRDISAAILTLKLADSGSAGAASVFTRVSGPSIVICYGVVAEIGRLPNNTDRYATGIVGTDFTPLSTEDDNAFFLTTGASGAGALESFLYWIGAIT